MKSGKPPQPARKAEAPVARSPAAEYLTLIAATGHSAQSLEMRCQDENIWLTQKMMAALYDVTVPTIRLFESNFDRFLALPRQIAPTRKES